MDDTSIIKNNLWLIPCDLWKSRYFQQQKEVLQLFFDPYPVYLQYW